MNISRRLNPHFVKLYSEKLNQNTVMTVPAKDLLFKKNRFDVLIKYVVVEAIDKGFFNSFYDKMFKDQVSVMTSGKFIEGDGNKNCYEDYVSSLKQLLCSMKKVGFDSKNSIIPVNSDLECLDGAHRIAVAAYLNLDVEVVIVDELTVNYSSQRFLKDGFDRKYLDYIALKAIQLNPKFHVVNIHSVVDVKEFDEFLIQEKIDVYYRKSIDVSRLAYSWVLRASYMNEAWIGNSYNRYGGARATSNVNKYIGKYDLDVLIIKFESIDEALKFKAKVREIYGCGNQSIHISDETDESLSLGQIFLNSNTTHFIKKSKLLDKTYLHRLEEELVRFKMWVTMNGFNLDDFIIDGSTCLGLYGQRETIDIDYIKYDGELSLPCSGFDDHFKYLKYHKISSDELVCNPDNYFYYDGIKVLSLSALRRFKSNRGEYPKDRIDLELIKRISEKNFSLLLRDLRIFFIPFLNMKVFNVSVKKFKVKLKAFLKQILNSDGVTYKILIKIKKLMKQIIGKASTSTHDIRKRDYSYEGEVNYYGVKLFSPKNTSIVKRFLRDGHYEKEEVDSLKKIFMNFPTGGTFLDVGANIGMISFALVGQLKNIRCFCFEPGPTQFKYLEKNIKENKMEHLVSAYNFALSNKTGEANFSIHKNEDVSGDGFVDTGRAGETLTIQVKTIKLDEWWKESNRPKIDVMKVDVEGAELMVFEGGKEFLENEKPLILFEVHNKNLEGYPYSYNDIFNFLQLIGYKILNLNFTSVSMNQRIKLNDNQNYGLNFIAVNDEKN